MMNFKVDGLLYIFLVADSYPTLSRGSEFSFVRASSPSRRCRRIFLLVIARLPSGCQDNERRLEKMISKGRAMSTFGKYVMKMLGRRVLLSERTLDSPG